MTNDDFITFRDARNFYDILTSILRSILDTYSSFWLEPNEKNLKRYFISVACLYQHCSPYIKDYKEIKFSQLFNVEGEGRFMFKTNEEKKSFDKITHLKTLMYKEIEKKGLLLPKTTVKEQEAWERAVRRI